MPVFDDLPECPECERPVHPGSAHWVTPGFSEECGKPVGEYHEGCCPCWEHPALDVEP